MTVTKYEDQFRELSRYALLEAWRKEALARKFLNRSLTKISRVVATQQYTTVSEIAKAARGMKYQDRRHSREPKWMKTESSFRGQ